MATYTETRTLDLLKHNGTAGAIPPVVMRRGDAGTVIQGIIKYAGEAFDLTGYSAKFCAVNAGGGVVRRDATITGAAEGTVTYSVTDDLTAVAGPIVVAYFEFTKGGEIATTDTVPFIVLADADIDAEHASPYQSELDRLNAQLTSLVRAYINSAEAEMDDAMADFAASMATLSDKIAEANAAIEAIGDISELAVPAGNSLIRGGFRTGIGLHVTDGDVLNLGPLTESGQGASVETDGCAIFGITGEGWAEQDGTPTPESPVPIQVCRGRNLLDKALLADPTLAVKKITLTLEPNTVYTMSTDAPMNNSALFYIAGGSTISESTSTNGVWEGNPRTVTSDSQGHVTIAYRITTYNPTLEPFWAQINTGSTPMPYVPFGHVGLEVQREDVSRVVFDGSSDEIWALTSTANLFSVRVYDAYAASAAADNYVWSDVYVTSQTTSNANQPDMSIKISAGGTYIYVKDTRYETLDALKAALAANPITFYYLNNKHTGSVPAFPTTTTPVPIPPSGLAALPDGTADSLRIDSAGHVVVTQRTKLVTFDGDEEFTVSNSGKRLITPVSDFKRSATTSTIANGYCTHFPASTPISTYADGTLGFAFNDTSDYFAFSDGSGAMVAADFKTWLSTHNVTVLYPLATSTTESGYINLPDLPSGAVVSIPELEEIGVSWFVAGAEAAVEHGNNVLKRVEALIAEIATA